MYIILNFKNNNLIKRFMIDILSLILEVKNKIII